MKHVPFSSATSLTFAKAKIKAGPLTIISNKIPELKSLGLKEGVGSNKLTVNQTRDLISLIRAHVSFSVSIHIRISLLCRLSLLSDGSRMSHIGQHYPIACRIEYK
jgi:hypothetical protein